MGSKGTAQSERWAPSRWGREQSRPQLGGTTVTFRLDADLSGLKGLVMGGMASKTMATEVRALDKAKAVLEG
jgi:hypothetical protein